MYLRGRPHTLRGFMTSSTRILSKMLKPELLQTAKGLDKRLAAQEKATMTLFYLTATAIAAAFIF